MFDVLAIAFRGLFKGEDFSGFFKLLVALVLGEGVLDGRCCRPYRVVFVLVETNVDTGRCWIIVGGPQSGDMRDSGTGIIFELVTSGPDEFTIGIAD